MPTIGREDFLDMGGTLRRVALSSKCATMSPRRANARHFMVGATMSPRRANARHFMVGATMSRGRANSDRLRAMPGFMSLALDEARAAGARGEVPIGAVLVHGPTGQILAQAGNRVE